MEKMKEVWRQKGMEGMEGMEGMKRIEWLEGLFVALT
jgi:hypothetical protein